MKDIFDDPLDTQGALAIEAQAADWLARKRFWTWNTDDQTQLDSWLAQSPAHEIAFWRLEGALVRTERLTALRPARTPRHWSPILARMAVAVVAVAALLAGYTIYTSRPAGIAYATSVGGRETIVLADGSRIELNTDTSIRVAETTTERRIVLEKGEAFFQVIHNATRPLVIYAGDRRVTDIGTKFSVRREPGQLVVAVMEGRVDYSTARSAVSLHLAAGETMVATADAVSVKRKTQHELSNALGWRRGVIVFNGTPLGGAIYEINRYNSHKIALADPKLANVKITATVSANDPAQFVRMTEFLLGLHGGKANGKVVLTQ